MTSNQENVPLVSVCIGSYNRESFIRACIDSVLAQTYSNLEIIVVDDASTDHTVDVVKSYGDRVRLIQRDVNSRCADIPRAQAVAAASGQWCALLDSDDCWHPEKLAHQMDAMLQHPDWVMSHTYVVVDDIQNGRKYVRHEGAVPGGPHVAAELLRHCFICTSSVVVRKALWLAAVEEIKPSTFGTEWDIFLAIARRHSIGFIAEPLVTYRKAGTGISHQNWKRVGNDLLALDRIYGKGIWRGIVSRRDMRRIWIAAALEGSVFWRDRSEWEKSRWFVGQGLKRSPFSTRLFMEGMKVLVNAMRHS